MNLKASSPKSRDNIFRQETGITPGYININIRHRQITVEYVFKFRNILNLIYHDVMHRIILNSLIQIIKQIVRVTEHTVSSVLKIDIDYMVCTHSLFL